MSLIVEINGKKFDYLQRSFWQKKLNDSFGKALNLVAYKDTPGIFFQIFGDGRGYILQKRKEDYSLEYVLDEIVQSRIVELVDLYFGNQEKFDSYFEWEKIKSGLTKEERKEYKRSNWKQIEIIKWISLVCFAGSFYLYIKLIGWNLGNSNYRIISIVGLFVASFLLFKYWRWESLNDKKYDSLSAATFKALLLAITGIIFGIAILIIPYLRSSK